MYFCPRGMPLYATLKYCPCGTNSFEFILFDLDGTLIDSKKGIYASLKYAFEKNGITYSGDMKKFIGPSFKNSFPLYLGADEELTKKLMVDYREIYAKKGIYNFKPFKGVSELLKALKSEGKKLILATNKPQQFAETILNKMNLYDLFYFIAGNKDGMTEKDQIINYIFDSINIARQKTVLIGDTIYDLMGASKTGIKCICVAYGYGNKDDFNRYNPLAIVNSPLELKNLLLSI